MDLFDNQAEQKIAQELLDKTFRGLSVSDELNAVSWQDRLSIARKMESIANKNSNIPDLILDIGSDANGEQHLKNMTVKGEWGGAFSSKPFFSKDVYDMLLDDKSVPLFGLSDNSKFEADQINDSEVLGTLGTLQLSPEGKPVNEQIEIFRKLVTERSSAVSDRK